MIANWSLPGAEAADNPIVARRGLRFRTILPPGGLILKLWTLENVRKDSCLESGAGVLKQMAKIRAPCHSCLLLAVLHAALQSLQVILRSDAIGSSEPLLYAVDTEYLVVGSCK
jgi:hypothetical protein